MCETCKQGIKCVLHPLWLMSDEQLADYVLNEAALRILVNTDRMVLA